jgi:hypothetical protein
VALSPDAPHTGGTLPSSGGQVGGPVEANRSRRAQRGSVPVEPTAYRVEVIRRLLERGVTVRSLEALLPGWETEIAAAIEQPPTADDQLEPQSGRPV